MEFQFNIMLTVALAVLLGTFGARVFKRLKVPQVVAYILIGVLLGATGLNVIDANTVEGLAPLSLLALGIIGFMIGGELKLEVFRRHGRRAMTILLAEGLGAFVVVTLLVGLVTRNWALALLLGARLPLGQRPHPGERAYPRLRSRLHPPLGRHVPGDGG
jgi:Kef-type K+ transport system membrane component KefB